jgi:hypothetical protein
MKLIIKPVIAFVLLLFVAAVATAQDAPKVDESNLINQLLSLGNNTAAQADSYFTGKKLTVVSRTPKDMGGYQILTIKYKMADSTDSYSIMTLKDQVLNAMYLNYSKDLYLKVVDLALQMGFKPDAAASPDAAQAVYSRGDERFIIRTTTTASGKTFYIFAATDAAKSGRAILAAKAHQ